MQQKNWHQLKQTIQGSEQISQYRAEGKAHPAKDEVLFYLRDDVSTALPGKRDTKKIAKRKCIQQRTLNDYLSNLHTHQISCRVSST